MIKEGCQCFTCRHADEPRVVAGYLQGYIDACDEIGLKEYSDPTNDIMTDYFGCNNSMIDYNGMNIKWAGERA